MGLDKSPRIREAVDAYILRESVVRLHADEIKKKVSVHETDIREYYKKNFEQVLRDNIKSDSEDEANEVWKELETGNKFRDLSRKHPAGTYNKTEDGIVFAFRSLQHLLRDIVLTLELAKISDIPVIQK